jgi:hypothetical protein
MAPKTDLPPRILRREVQRYAWELARRRVGRDSEGGVAPVAGAEESLPVLEAFQEFLDTERRRSRNRVIAVAGLSFLMVLLMGGGILVTGALMLRDLDAGVESLRRRLELVGSAAADQLKDTERITLALRKDVDGLLVTLSEKAKGPDVAAEWSVERAAFSNALTLVQSNLSELSGQNLALRTELDRFRSEVAAVRAASDRPRAEVTASLPEPVRSVLANGADAVRKPEVTRPHLVISVLPAGEPAPVKWRLPIPE